MNGNEQVQVRPTWPPLSLLETPPLARRRLQVATLGGPSCRSPCHRVECLFTLDSTPEWPSSLGEETTAGTGTRGRERGKENRVQSCARRTVLAIFWNTEAVRAHGVPRIAGLLLKRQADGRASRGHSMLCALRRLDLNSDFIPRWTRSESRELAAGSPHSSRLGEHSSPLLSKRHCVPT